MKFTRIQRVIKTCALFARFVCVFKATRERWKKRQDGRGGGGGGGVLHYPVEKMSLPNI